METIKTVASVIGAVCTLICFWQLLGTASDYPKPPKDIEISAAHLAELARDPTKMSKRYSELILLRDAVRRALLQMDAKREADEATEAQAAAKADGLK